MSVGLKRGTVRLVEHDPSWEEEFEREVARVKVVLPNEVGPFEHIGSTSIPGIPAKPIIDFMVGVPNLSVAFQSEAALTGLGYVHRPNGDTPDRVLYVRGPEELRTHHFSFVLRGSDQWLKSLGFRELLRQDPSLATQYTELKRELELQFPNDRASYTAAKEPFFQEILKIIAPRSTTQVEEC